MTAPPLSSPPPQPMPLPGDDNLSSLRFEDALADLEQAVEDLEAGDLSLDDSLKRYETGIQRVALCRRILAQAESRIEILRRGTDGTLRAEPWSLRATDEGKPSPPSVTANSNPPEKDEED